MGSCQKQQTLFCGTGSAQSQSFRKQPLKFIHLFFSRHHPFQNFPRACFLVFSNEFCYAYMQTLNRRRPRCMRHNIIFLLLFSIFLVACGDNPETISDQTEQTNAQETAAEQAGANSDAVQSDELAVHFIDVGQADATLFHYKGTDSQYAILYDVGDWQGDEMVPYLQKESIDFIDLIIISHPHADHIGQLDSIMDHFDAGEVWMSGNAANTDLFQDAMEAVLESDADYDEPKAGAMYDIGPLELAILHPETLSGDLNEDSLSVRFTYGNVSFLFTGDAYQEQENEMIGRGIPLEADVLQLGHHGSDTSNDPLFIDAVNPAYAIY